MTVKERWRNHWFSPRSAASLAAVRIAVYSLLFVIYCGTDDRGWTRVSSVFWMPVSFFRLLPGPPRSAAVIAVLQTVWKISLFTSALGFATRLSVITAAGLGFYVLGLPACFGKIHHLDGFPVLLLGILAISRCADALALDRFLRPRRNPAPSSADYTWPLRLGQVLFLLIFFAAGYAKLRNSGLAWISAANMRAIWLGELLTHAPPTRMGAWLAQSDTLCWLGAAATVGIELSALPAIFLRRWRVFTLAGLLSLQIMIALMLGVYFTPHLAGYALFIPWHRLARGSPR